MRHIRLSTGMTRSVMRVAGASVAAQGVALAISPILARLYGPSDLGVYAYITALVSTVGIVAGLRLEMAIPICPSDEEAAQVARVASGIALVTSAVVALSIPLVGVSVDDASPLDLMPYLWWLPPSILTLALFTIMSQLTIRSKDFGAVARRNVTQAWTTATAQVILGYRPSPGGLLAGQALGRGFAAALLWWSNRAALGTKSAISHRAIWRRYWRFPALFAPSAVLNTLGLTLPVLMIGTWFGADAAGQFDLAARLVLGPAVIVGAAASQVLLGEMADLRRTSDPALLPLFRSVALRLTAIAVPFGLAVMVLSPWVFAVVFGEDWEQAGLNARLMAPVAAMSLVAGPLSQVFFVLEHGSTLILVDTTRVLLLVVGGGAAYMAGGSQVLVTAAVLGAMFIAQLVSFVVSWRLVAIHDNSFQP